MPRPMKFRRICALPGKSNFGPAEAGGAAADDTVMLLLDEYEAIRLIDLLGYTQEECAAQMGVARTTVQAVYDSARRKLADMLVHGRHLSIVGGSYMLCDYAERGCCCGSRRRHCQGRRCEENGGEKPFCYHPEE